jgi:hypothetical protein
MAGMAAALPKVDGEIKGDATAIAKCYIRMILGASGAIGRDEEIAGPSPRFLLPT